MTNIKITGKNIEITEGMRNSIFEKLSFLDKFLKDTDTVKVTVSTRKTKLKITVIVHAFGKIVKIEREVSEFYEGLEIISDKLKNTIQRQHDFMVKQNREKLVESIDEESNNPIKVYKTVECEEMTEDEAIEKMEELGYDFFMFNKNNSPCVLYRRFDGSYGMIETTNN